MFHRSLKKGDEEKKAQGNQMSQVRFGVPATAKTGTTSSTTADTLSRIREGVKTLFQDTQASASTEKAPLSDRMSQVRFGSAATAKTTASQSAPAGSVSDTLARIRESMTKNPPDQSPLADTEKKALSNRMSRVRFGRPATEPEISAQDIDTLRLWSNITGIKIEFLARNDNLKKVQYQANLISLKQQQQAERAGAVGSVADNKLGEAFAQGDTASTENTWDVMGSRADTSQSVYLKDQGTLGYYPFKSASVSEAQAIPSHIDRDTYRLMNKETYDTFAGDKTLIARYEKALSAGQSEAVKEGLIDTVKGLFFPDVEPSLMIPPDEVRKRIDLSLEELKDFNSARDYAIQTKNPELLGQLNGLASGSAMLAIGGMVRGKFRFTKVQAPPKLAQQIRQIVRKAKANEAKVAGVPNIVDVRKGVEYLTPAKFAELPVSGVIDPKIIRYSQDDIKAFFKSPYGSLDDFIGGLKSGSIDATSIKPVRLVEKDGKIWTLDNRRLYSYQEAGIKIPYKKLDAVPKKDAFKFSTINDGTSIIIRKGKQ